MLIPTGILAASGAARATYELISTSLISSPTGNFNFTNIPQDYKHLQLRITMRGDGGSATFAGAFDFHPISGGSTYSQHYMQNSGTSVSSAGNSSLGIINFPELPAGGATANVFGVVVMDILDYTSTSKNKTVRLLSGSHQDGTYWRIDERSGAWYDTGAISAIRMRPYGVSNFVAGSRFSLYGVRG
jgi:hypothetical protein